MSHEIMVETIKAELAHVDALALQSIWQIIDNSKKKPPASPIFSGDSAPLPVNARSPSDWRSIFAGENLTLDEYERLSPKERGELQRRLKERNHLWLGEKFSELRAAWLVVINGEVFAWGKSLDDLPLAPENVELSRRTGKFPFVFINDVYWAIEESVSAWHATTDFEDFYPTLPVTLGLDSNVFEMIGDFDTGAFPTFADYDFLRAQDLIKPEAGDYYEFSSHLSQSYKCVGKRLRLQLSSKAGEVYALETKIYCVPDWHKSPFVKINPDRVALIGRGLLLKLKPMVLLNFKERQSEIMDSATTAPVLPKIAKQKKRTSRSRRRR